MSDDRTGPRRRIELLFIVRVRREDGAAPEQLRGSVLDVATGRRLLFTSLADLSDFLYLRLDAGGREPHATS
jgi:hypothetical protein